MKSVGSFLRLIPQLERRRESAGSAAAAVAPYDLLALKAKDTQLLIMLPALNRQTKKLKASLTVYPLCYTACLAVVRGQRCYGMRNTHGTVPGPHPRQRKA